MEKNIVLVSNVRDPRNTTTGHFFTKLATPLKLEGNWNVGLKKMIYLNTTHNISENAYIEIEHHAETNKIRNPDRAPHLVYDMLRPHNLNVYFRMNDYANHAEMQFKFNADKNKPKTEFRYYKVECFLGDDRKKTVYKRVIDPLIQIYTLKFPDGMWTAGDSKLDRSEMVNDLYVQIGYWSPYRLPIPEGYYNTVESLTSTINDLSAHMKEWVHFEYNSSLNRTIINVKNVLLHHINLSDDIKLALGFKSSQYSPSSTNRRIVGEEEPELQGGLFPLHILTNIVEPMLVGEGVYQPMLETIAVDANRGHFGEIIEHVVKSPLYRPVAIRDQIDEIEIKIVDDMGRQVRFDNIHGDAKTLLLLHFYKVNDYK